MSLDFNGKVAIVTGGATGIGEATARKLAGLGAAVAIFDVNEGAGAATAESISSSGAQCAYFVCDVSDAQSVERATTEVVSRFGGLDVLISNAGIQDYGDVVSTSEDAWDRLMAVNLKGCFLAAKNAVPHLLKRGNAAIVAVGSVQSMAANMNSVAYVAAKHGLLGLVRAMALDYAQKGIRVNCVCPGTVDTPMLRWAAGLDKDPEAVLRICAQMHAMGRIARPEEIADAIAYLASTSASFITGAALLVDGGMLIPAGGMAFQAGGTGAATRS
jgi:NAD(P)-dependent dehydrogenase (short-subunit alcohol dehydrogenase family)